MRFKTLLLATFAMLALAAPAAAAVKVKTIASGLDNPRHLAFGGKGLYVAEAGRGGSGPCFPSPEGGTACVGDSGRITLITKHGKRHVVTGLASFADQVTGNGAIGPHGIFATGHGNVFFTNGGPTGVNRDDLAAGNPVANLFGRVFKLRRHKDPVSLVDVWDFERDNNPDAEVGNPEVDSNAVDVLIDGRRIVIADAGGNSVLKARKGNVRVLALFANREVDFNGQTVEMQAVPTSVVKGPRDSYFVSQLTGFPFPVGGANVYKVNRKTGQQRVFASGFTNIMDLAFDRRGNLWVLEIDHDSLLTPTADGAIYRVDRKGNKKQLSLPAGTLTHPGGITVGRDGNLYVTNHGDTAGNGEVLRIKTHKAHRRHRNNNNNKRPY
jgi:hypothetical protein